VTRRHVTAFGFVLFGVMAFLGAVSAQRVGRQMMIARTCTAVLEGRFEEALAQSNGLPGADPDGRYAAECRCRALEAVGRFEECVALLDPLLEEAPDWAPAPDLAAAVVRARRERGEARAAAQLARRAAASYPRDAALAQLEIATRSPIEGEDAVLEELGRRLEGEAPALGLRLALAVSHSRRHDHARVAEVLGEEPPPAGDPYVGFWFQARAWALAGLGDLPGLRASYDAWRSRGGDPHAIEADYALQLSIAQLRDPERDWITLLRGALEHEDALSDPKVPAALYLRWIGHLLMAGDYAEALRIYDRASQRYELAGITREQIVQEQVIEGLGEAAGVPTQGTLVFTLRPDAPAGTLWISPDVGAEPDVAFQPHALAPGSALRLARGAAVTPQRWVFRTADRTLASGSAWPTLGVATAIEIRPNAERTRTPELFQPAPHLADGRRRVFVVIPDCGDWRLTQYLRARGELPVFDALLARGRRAVLESDPPVTAAAMEKLVWPDRGAHMSVLGELNRLGLELGGLASVGRNPLGFLAAVLPEGRSLFEVVGSGRQVAANLLFSHGAIDAGRHAEQIGPNGVRRPGPTLQAWRELSEPEARIWRSAGSERAREHARTIAAEMDAALAIARAGEVDFLMLRLEALDLLTHELFGELVGTQQDDGRSALLDAYRYIDGRLGELWNALDGDDVLIVMSDHGVRTAMEHARDAIFVAVGEGISPGRVAGRPEIAGVPRALAALLGRELAWPETGLAASLVPEMASELARVRRDP
jgi:hypothetical protein